MNENRGPWYLITGLVLGVLLGLGVAWLIRPPSNLIPKVKPAALQADYKDQYRLMIALAYQVDSDLVRAQARLDLLADPDVYKALAVQAQRAQAAGSPDAQALGLLASAVRSASAATPATLPTPFATIVFTPTLNIPNQP
jgi:hypothetical protein